MTKSTEIVRANLRRMIEADGRGLTVIAQTAFPDRSVTAGRKLIERSIEKGWLRDDVADGLRSAFGVRLAEFYLPIEPKLKSVHVCTMRLRAARTGLGAARKAFTAELRASMDKLATDARALTGAD